MKVDILTYLFEIINFFVLLWILKKLLYKPIISVLKERKEYIAKRIREAEEAETKAKRMKEEYEKMLKQIEEIRKTKLAEITKEVQQEKEKLYENMKKELDAQRQKFLDSLEMEKREALNEIKEETIHLSLAFVSKLLSNFADEEIHKKLFSIALEGIKNINKEEIDNIKEELKNRNTVVVETAFPLSKEDIDRLKQTIKDIFNVDINIKTEERKDLMAGVKIHLSSKMIDTSLEGQLSVFETLLREKIEIT